MPEFMHFVSRISNTTQDLFIARRLIRRYFTKAHRFTPTDAIFATWKMSNGGNMVKKMFNIICNCELS